MFISVEHVQLINLAAFQLPDHLISPSFILPNSRCDNLLDNLLATLK
jgi:hypothetical protein